MLQQFPNLESVSLSGNRVVGVPPKHSFWFTNAFTNIKILNLNSCGIQSFATIKILSQALPNLEELCLAHNNLSDMGDLTDQHSEFNSTLNFHDIKCGNPSTIRPTIYFKNLTLLDLSDCKIASWNEQILPLRTLSIELLILNNNPITSITIAQSQPDCKVSFAKLKSIHIAGCDIQCWSSIDNLRYLPSLLSLRFRYNPVTSNMGTGEARSIIISRLPQIAYVNGSIVTPKERIQAERNYIRSVAREILLAESMRYSNSSIDLGGTEPTDCSKSTDFLPPMHPRFGDLLKKHGENLTTIKESNGIGGRIAAATVNVTIRSMAASSCTMEALRKRLPVTLNVRRLKYMCFKAFNLEIARQSLHFRTVDNPFPIPLDDDENMLSFYGVTDGSEILMNEVNDTTH